LTGERFVNVIAGVVIETKDEDVVDIDSDKHTTIGVIIDTWVGVQAFEAEAEDIIAEEQIPNTRRLLEAVERFVETKNLASVLFESFRLFDIEFEITVAVQESCFGIDMDDVETEESGDGEEASYGVDSNDRGEGFLEIQSSNLGVSFGDKSSFIPLKIVVPISFCLEYPFGADASSILWWSAECPCVVVLD
jgi:hypothetical protein